MAISSIMSAASCNLASSGAFIERLEIISLKIYLIIIEFTLLSKVWKFSSLSSILSFRIFFTELGKFLLDLKGLKKLDI